MIMAKKPVDEADGKAAAMESWYSPPDGEKNAYETLLSSTEDHPDVAKQVPVCE